ncbi:tumor necrosis factor ligand superfamily member 4 isoform X2 [Fukomys damarensis]|uniref:tumor necrosis factor ligand superfamily member 4 isoform X2 n=1 Tax=Fukomys damarensis TaxID=885580 RepID=UPI00053F9270|nr:tumor necrosis factor ligand superfamily member 4 isoform X2 [Fukomys damarensis]
MKDFLAVIHGGPGSSRKMVQHPPVQSISLLLTGCEEEKLTLIPNNAQIMTVENNSVIITCDGFYLISVKGYFQEEVSISLHYRMHQNPISIPLRKDLQADFTTVVSLAYKDKVYLSINSPNTSCEDFRMNGGELYLIQQNPGGFCI